MLATDPCYCEAGLALIHAVALAEGHKPLPIDPELQSVATLPQEPEVAEPLGLKHLNECVAAYP